MNLLKHIETEVCPICGAIAVADRRKDHEHCNGRQFESREFACGYKLEHEPNMGNRIQVAHSCKDDPVIVLKYETRKAAYDKIVAFFETLDLDTDYRKTIDSYLTGYIKSNAEPPYHGLCYI